MTINVYMLGGTGFPEGGDGITETFLAHLDERFLGQVVHYPAAGFGTGGMNWAQSRAAGKRALIDAIRSTDNLAVIGGYSQGAGIAGDLAAEIGAGKHRDLEVVGCALIADPARPAGATMPGIPSPPGYGVIKSRPIPKIPTWWAAANRDPITALDAGSPLRTIADAADYFSLSSPQDAAEWGRKLIERAIARNFQPWWSPQYWRDWPGAIQEAVNYTPIGGRHTRAYLTEGLCTELAIAVNRGVR